MRGIRDLSGLLCIEWLLACAPSAPPAGIDLLPPYLLGTNLPAGGQTLDPSIPLVLRFSEPLDETRLGEAMIVLVPHQLGAPCATDLACGGDSCYEGVCQHDPVDENWISDLAHPPLARERRARVVPLLVTLEIDPRAVRIVPQRPLNPGQRHTLLVGPGLADRAGNPVARPAEDSPLVLTATFATSATARGRPLLRLASPPAGTSGLPTNLSRVMVLSSEAVRGITEQALWLELPTSQRVKARVQASALLCRGHAAGCCHLLELEEPLPPNEIVQLKVDERLVTDRDGQRALVDSEQSLATGAASDQTGPWLDPLRVLTADRCVVVRLRTEEPSDLWLLANWSAEPGVSVGTTHHELAITIPGARDSNGVLELSVHLRDLAGNEAPPQKLVIEPPAVPRVAVTEVLANPAGPEPAQEFVELRNLSSDSVDLTAWTIDDNDDGAGAAVLPQASLAPGQYAVVVGKGYLTSTDTDPAPAPGALLVRLPRLLGAAGLSNAGEPLVLRDRDGQLVSSYGSHYSASGKGFNGRSVERVPDEACDVEGSWRPNPAGSSTPGLPPAQPP